ncbi:hypothetical protein MSG28_000424 [Choristoneura fumiferana]|uniref:Uncharacterized protein n=1 Tax=Choristoneura fumiferana TaxID=7141 RepID=A0ACC0K0K7_CHOFU|nr:hypothetical protein MSG28_000424 [Choristoneura fumiferana]
MSVAVGLDSGRWRSEIASRTVAAATTLASAKRQGGRSGTTTSWLGEAPCGGAMIARREQATDLRLESTAL